MRILIFGGTGLLGQALYKELSKSNICFQSSKKKKSDFQSDLQSSNKIYSFLKKTRPNVIINCAGETDVNHCNDKFYSAYNSNVKSIQNIVQAVKSYNKKIYLIHISTDQVYNTKNKSSSEDNVFISNNYGATKFISEIEALKTNNTLIIRTNFFGKSLSKNRISYSDYIISNLKRKKKIYVPKNVIFNPVNIDFLIKVIKKALKLKTTGIFNVGSKNSISKYNFAKKIAKKYNLNKKFIFGFKSIFAKHQRPLNTTMCVKKLYNKMRIKIPSINDCINLL